jgi:phthiocerol/phenolphthiocerol synthesis type-I polyketide synthase E
MDFDRLSTAAHAFTPIAPRYDDHVAADAQGRELKVIIDIWKDLLGVDSISPSDNFFTLGGHSLMGTMMIARIRDRLGITLSLRDVFEERTPEGIAALVCSRAEEKTPVEQVAEPAPSDDKREVFEF